ncbi:YqhR family membrane protein [Oceanobacillus manasiensis]|uniref:YqhR family membrane protein n=1 Tax=Oceanobacillus manasiensis TaxID=586413 RepID=UPI0005A65297|nr:YqhR family membrane protein [Oceanobacillus manasiensis]
MSDNKQLDQNKREEPLTLLSRSAITGFVGGVFWGLLATLLAYFNFTEVAPKAYVLRSWTTASWTNGWLGTVITILILGGISILVAFIYYLFMRKINTMWMGVAYGAILWGIVFFVLEPIFTNIKPIRELNQETIVTTICLYVLYGTFIGYSLSYDYHDKVMKAKNEKNMQA